MDYNPYKLYARDEELSSEIAQNAARAKSGAALRIWKQAMKLGVGLCSLSKDQIERFVTYLCEEYGLTEEEGREMVKVMLEHSKARAQELRNVVEEHTRAVREEIHNVYRAKIAELEAKVQKLKKESGRHDQLKEKVQKAVAEAKKAASEAKKRASMEAKRAMEHAKKMSAQVKLQVERLRKQKRGGARAEKKTKASRAARGAAKKKPKKKPVGKKKTAQKKTGKKAITRKTVAKKKAARAKSARSSKKSSGKRRVEKKGGARRKR
ncbi:hypothetical protein D6783_01440 [Candidatus Woesearchaeota archaeon]|nr:MAG: hypothetical protein D6783_01440 [Candidatus Woesearchaeota archaeon]